MIKLNDFDKKEKELLLGLFFTKKNEAAFKMIASKIPLKESITKRDRQMFFAGVIEGFTIYNSLTDLWLDNFRKEKKEQ